MNVNEVLDYFGKDAGAFAEFIDRYIEGPILAQDLQPGQLSSAELAKFKQYPPQKQNQVIKLLERIGFYQTRNPTKARELQAQLDRLSRDTRLKELRQRRAHTHDESSPIKAAGVIFKTPKGEVLLVERSTKGDHSGEWAFPGGVTESGESPDETAAREAEEEVGYYPNELEPFHHHVLDGVDFTTFVQDVDAPFEPRINNESSKAAWHSLGDLPAPLHPGVAKMLDEKLLAADEELPTKLSQEEVHYGPGKGDTRCDHCMNFLTEEPHCEIVEDPITAGGWCDRFAAQEENAIAEDSRFDGLIIDSDHDGPWMSCMSKDGRTMYVNKNLPSIVPGMNKAQETNIQGGTVEPYRILLHHEVPEWEEIQELLAEFKAEHNREPNVSERKQIYLKAHHSSGTPQEREYCKANNIDWDAWSAWCRGEEAKVEKLKPTNPPPDEDVKPIPHGHGDLEITMDGSRFVFDEAGFKEEDHPRGNSKNAGQFSKGGGSPSKAPQKPAEKANGTSKSEKGSGAHPEAKNAPTGSSELRSFLKGKLSEADLDHALSLINKEKPEKSEHGEHKEHRSPKEHVQRIQEFFKQPNVAKNISQSVSQLLKHHGKGLAEHTFNHNLVLPAVHTALALTLGHMGATVPEIVATNVAGYALHQLAHHVGFHPKGAMKALKFVVKHLLDAHKIGELKAAVGGEDAAPEKEDEIGASLQRLLDILDKHSPEDLIKNAKLPADLEDEPKSEDSALGVDSYLAMDRGISSLLSEQQLQYLNARQGIAFDRSMREYDAEGRLHVARTPISKANICPYLGYEIPDWETLGLSPNKIYQLFRDPTELAKAAPTFNGIQVLRKHIPVSIDDHRPYDVVGATGTDAEFVEPYLYNSMTVWAKEDVEGIEDETKVELSAAYRYKAVMEPGTYKGAHFDGRMTQIVGNHLAICQEGRAGSDVAVADAMPPELSNHQKPRLEVLWA